MSGKVELVYTVSKKGYELVKAGKAVISSGGLRMPDGSLLELAKPAVQGFTGSVSSPLTLASSLSNNIQSGFIQHGVNQANQKLDLSLEKLDRLERTVDALASRSNVLSWASCAFSMANCGISIAGFYITLKKMDQVSAQISTLIDKIDRAMVNEMQERYHKYRLNLSSDLGLLQTFRSEVTKTPSFEINLNEIAAFLGRIISEFESRTIDGVLGCSLIFGLAVPFAQGVREYSTRFYYENGGFPANYDSWLEMLRRIDSETFQNLLKNFLVFDHPELRMEERYAAFSGGTSSSTTTRAL